MVKKSPSWRKNDSDKRPQSPWGWARSFALRRRLWAFYGWLDTHPGARPLIGLAVALWVTLLIAPDLRLHRYPTDAALVGLPVTENIKAPYDLELTDVETTARLEEEALGAVRQVYDYDSEVSDRVQERITQAFVVARMRAEPATLVRAAFEEKLGVPVDDAMWQLVATHQFAPAIESALLRLVGTVQGEPLVAAIKSIEGERGRGLALQRVPAHSEKNGPALWPAAHNGYLIINDISMVHDVASGREQAMRLAQYLADNGKLLAADQALQSQFGPKLAEIFGRTAASLLQPNLTFNRAATQAARTSAHHGIHPVKVTIKKGEMIIRDGERLTPRHLMIFRGFNEGGSSAGALRMAGGGLVLLLTMGALAAGLLGIVRRDAAPLSSRDVLFLALVFVLSLTLCRVWLHVGRVLHEIFTGIGRDVWLFCLPVSMGALVTRLVLRTEFALMFAVMHSLALALLANGDRLLSLYALAGCIAAIAAIRTISARSDLLRAGLWAGLAQAMAAVGIQLFEGTAVFSQYVSVIPAAIFGGLSGAVLALSITPMLEWTFNYTTDLKLLELANLNHPALKELIVQAPGSYHHSIVVGALVEAAAESIGANSLLARVMAYYHDLGKGCNSGYFIENQRMGQNPHDKLRPSMSAMIIRRHVTDGIALAKHYGLGEQITDGIAQHHGNTLIHVFYHKAKEQAEPGQVIQEADYRYPGEKPQTREAALVMLGDSIEAASRAQAEPTAARLQGLVNRIISAKFADGQLEECDLTLRDLHTIAKSFQTVLAGIYHHRLEYPDAVADQAKKATRPEAEPKAQRNAEAGVATSEKEAKDHLKRLGLS